MECVCQPVASISVSIVAPLGAFSFFRTMAAFVSAGRPAGFVLDVEILPVAASVFEAPVVSVGLFFTALPLRPTLALLFTAGADSPAAASLAFPKFR
jgi:hypothetical protein